MPPSNDDDPSRRNRAQCRANMPGEVITPGVPKPSLYENLTPRERFEQMSGLCRAQWEASGRVVTKLPRSQWPGEVFKIGHE